MKYTRKFFILSFTLFFFVLTSGNSFAATQRFPDVSREHTFYQYVMVLSDAQVVNGFSSGEFKPEQKLKRQEIAKFVKRGFDLPTNTTCETFPDVDNSNAFFEDIMTLKCSNIIGGYQNGEFKPDNLVTRAEAMSFIIKAARVKADNPDFLPKTQDDAFPDVEKENVHYENIMSGVSNNIVSGDNGMFKPDDAVSRGAISKMITNTRLHLTLTSEDQIRVYESIKEKQLESYEENEYVVYYPADYIESTSEVLKKGFRNANPNASEGYNNLGVASQVVHDDGMVPNVQYCRTIADQVAGSFIDPKISSVVAIVEPDIYGCYFVVNFTAPNGIKVVLEEKLISERVSSPKDVEMYEFAIGYSEESDPNEVLRLQTGLGLSGLK